MEPTKQELKAAKRALRKEAREAKKAEKLLARQSFKEAVLAKVEELKNK